MFLRTVSATMIPALAVPISLAATCGMIYLFGFSINNMTLLALTLSVGFVVDDAIVMLENIVRHIEGGMRPYEAALKGSREIGFIRNEFNPSYPVDGDTDDKTKHDTRRKAFERGEDWALDNSHIGTHELNGRQMVWLIKGIGQ